MKVTIWVVSGVLALASCSPSTNQDSMQSTNADSTQASTALEVFNLANESGVKVSITNFGGRVISIWVPDKNGQMANIVLGYDSVSQYLDGNPYFGALIGRYGNRIANGKFLINSKTYSLEKNNGENALHGGPKGFHNVYWRGSKKITDGNESLELTYLSKDGEEGYPGNLNVKVTYTLSQNNELIIDYTAVTDKPTVINLTHHSFFNLAGEGNGDILEHSLMINANKFTPVDAGLIPTGELRDVIGTPFDFTSPHLIGERIGEANQQLRFGKGYDHNWVLRKSQDSLTLAAVLREPNSGRTMEVWTTEPGLQFYSGNFLDGNDKGFGGKPYKFRSALCLEAQHFPDSPNHKNFPSTVLSPGEEYHQKTIYKFGIL